MFSVTARAAELLHRRPRTRRACASTGARRAGRACGRGAGGARCRSSAPTSDRSARSSTSRSSYALHVVSVVRSRPTSARVVSASARAASRRRASCSALLTPPGPGAARERVAVGRDERARRGRRPRPARARRGTATPSRTSASAASVARSSGSDDGGGEPARGSARGRRRARRARRARRGRRAASANSGVLSSCRSLSYASGSPLTTASRPVSRPIAVPAFPRASSATSGFSFCGIIDEPSPPTPAGGRSRTPSCTRGRAPRRCATGA